MTVEGGINYQKEWISSQVRKTVEYSDERPFASISVVPTGMKISRNNIRDLISAKGYHMVTDRNEIRDIKRNYCSSNDANLDDSLRKNWRMVFISNIDSNSLVVVNKNLDQINIGVFSSTIHAQKILEQRQLSKAA